MTRKIRQVAVIGAGVMGGDSAAGCALRWHTVTLQYREQKDIDAAPSFRAALDNLVQWAADFAPMTFASWGDFDNDGDVDLVFGDSGGGQARLYLNNGSGSFVDGTSFSAMASEVCWPTRPAASPDRSRRPIHSAARSTRASASVLDSRGWKPTSAATVISALA